MRTEAKRTYSSGFALTEQELRRIHDVADQQMKRVLPESAYETVYELRYSNGAISEFHKLDEVFQQENWGSAAIRLVSLVFREKPEDAKTKIVVTFADVSAAMSNTKRAISYEIEGEDRDWVFVASSQLSERIARVTRFNIPYFVDSRWFATVTFLLAMIVLLLLTFWDSSGSRNTYRTNAINDLRNKWKLGELKDSVDAILRVQEVDIQSQNVLDRNVLMHMLIPIVGMPILLFGLSPLLSYVLPPYNFLWGEYQRDYEKRNSRVRFVLVGVILTVVLAILANVLTKRFGW